MNNLTLLVKPASSACDMRCGYCFYSDVARRRAEGNRGIMDRRTSEELVSKIFAAAPARVSILFQGGEPLLAGLPFYENFVSLIKKHNANGIPVNLSIQTNGLSVDAEWAEFFRANGFLTGLSLDGPEDVHDAFRRDASGRGTFDRVLRAAETLAAHGAEFNVVSVVTDLSAGRAEETYRFFRSLGFRHLQFIPCMDDLDGGARLSPEGWGRFLTDLFDPWYEDFVRGDVVGVRNFEDFVSALAGLSPATCGARGVCGVYFAVESDGSTYPCDFYCLDEYRLGSVFDPEPFALDGKHRRFVEESLPVPDECAVCGYRRLCRNGCRRDRVGNPPLNKYCSSLKAFFGAVSERLGNVLRILRSAPANAGEQTPGQ